ncbi:MAG: ABC transporter permease, partial [Aliifodinibius sp.]|nr:ABC transporter permease [Fodinibius sp.]NIV13194.1 ABC transporter permease [Fodinibius sp.]NIY26859.1 ABC transporter permease [Fodinibius sp.]
MSLGYVVKEGIAGISRAKLAAFTSIFSLFIAVLLLGLLSRLGYNGYEVAQSLKKSIDVEVFLMDLDERTTDELSERLKEEELVQDVTYISKDSAAAVFEKEFGSAGSSLADLKFLPASFKLNIDPNARISQVDSLVGQLQSYRGIDEVR